MAGFPGEDIDIKLWEIVVGALLVLVLVVGLPLALPVAAGGVVGRLVKGATTADGLRIGLCAGIIGAATTIGVLVLITALEDRFADDGQFFLTVSLLVMGVNLLSVAIAACLTWRHSKQAAMPGRAGGPPGADMRRPGEC